MGKTPEEGTQEYFDRYGVFTYAELEAQLKEKLPELFGDEK